MLAILLREWQNWKCIFFCRREGRFSVWLLRFDALSSMGPPPICRVLWKYKKNLHDKRAEMIYSGALIRSGIKGRGTLYYLAKRGNLFWAGHISGIYGAWERRYEDGLKLILNLYGKPFFRKAKTLFACTQI